MVSARYQRHAKHDGHDLTTVAVTPFERLMKSQIFECLIRFARIIGQGSAHLGSLVSMQTNIPIYGGRPCDKTYRMPASPKLLQSCDGPWCGSPYSQLS